MPHLFFSGHSDEKSAPAPTPTNTTEEHEHDKENMWERTWKQMGHWLKKEDENESPPPQEQTTATTKEAGSEEPLSEKVPSRPSHNVIPSRPRPITFKRQDSERRERLYPHEPDHEERRATSVDRRLGTSCEQRKISPLALPEIASSIPKPIALDASNGSEIAHHSNTDFASTESQHSHHKQQQNDEDHEGSSHYDWHHTHPDILNHSEQLSDALSDLQIQNELEAKWILNLSMHFRDHSDREKFFVTYAEEPNRWRRVTVSCDYRYAPHDSLEADLKSLHYQRDKSARIYEAIRDSLPSIQFYSTVTNLKLETSDGRLHVHVTEDVNEIIQYPHISAIAHLELPEYAEETIEFDCHMSGFVYKVRTSTPRHNPNGSRALIKKEIPGPEAVEEFLYEIHALSALRGEPNVVRLEGIVLDKHDQIKGVLLEYCEKGALVDILYDFRHSPLLPLQRRLRWARQAVSGLAQIHEAGFVQGDFTLSNIVVDENDDAFIIDINRRGCPIGWEPPELAGVIRAGGRVGMYIGVKSDLFQLGMVLWALAEGMDEPERIERPLRWKRPAEIPAWYKNLTEQCLSTDPRSRPAAKELLGRFQTLDELIAHSDIPMVEINASSTTEGASEPQIVQASKDASDSLEVRQPSPFAGAAVSDIDKNVEYLSRSAELPPRQDEHLQAEDVRPSNGNASRAQEDDAEMQNEKVEQQHQRAQCPPQQPQPCWLTSDRDILVEESVPDVAAPYDGVSSVQGDPIIEVAATAQLAMPEPQNAIKPEVLDPSKISPSFELGNPPLASITPPEPAAGAQDASVLAAQAAPLSTNSNPAQTIDSKEFLLKSTLPLSDGPRMLSEQPTRTSSFGLELGNPPLATLSPLPETSDPISIPKPSTVSEFLNSPSTIMDFDAQPKAVFSVPEPHPLSAAASPLPETEPATEQVSSVETVLPAKVLDLGNPPLATISPIGSLPASPPNVDRVAPLANKPVNKQDESAASSDAPSVPEAKLRTNTLGLEMPPKHQDSGFDEPMSAAATSAKEEKPTSLLAETLQARNSSMSAASPSAHAADA